MLPFDHGPKRGHLSTDRTFERSPRGNSRTRDEEIPRSNTCHGVAKRNIRADGYHGNDRFSRDRRTRVSILAS